MGCDIHMILEVKPAGATQFQMVGSMDQEDDNYITPHERYSGRNYNLFAVLANVRNGSGFAGCDTGDRIQPIADPRGVPDDASPEYMDWVEQWGGDGHSHSYHTLEQLLDYDWTQTKVQRGFVELHEYARWKGYAKGQGDSPDSWCGDVGGGRTVKITEAEADKLLVESGMPNCWDQSEWAKREKPSTYVAIEWTQPSARTIGSEFWYAVICPLLKLAKEHGRDNVRAVFFFDN